MTSSSSSSSSSSRSRSSMLEGMIARLLAAHVDRPGTIIDLDEPDIVSVCASVRQIVLSEPVLLRTEAPITLCGDLHGQFYDLLRILEHSGTLYMFLDYIYLFIILVYPILIFIFLLFDTEHGTHFLLITTIRKNTGNQVLVLGGLL